MLEWNVFVENFNKRIIEVHNVFSHYGFLNDCRKYAQQCEDRTEFEKKVISSLKYFYWSKCEWEIILSDWPPSDTFHNKKVSVYDQIMINGKQFFDYLWANKDELKQAEEDI